MAKREVWISDHSNAKYQKIKGHFLEAMVQQTKDQKINYYDFLLVAKKLSFRFEESSHLMALKNFFARNKNAVLIKKMADLLCISQESLHAQEQKIIVKFPVVQMEFAPIKQQTHEDEDEFVQSEVSQEIFSKIGSDLWNQEQRQINQKIAIILTIKVTEMQKKIKNLLSEQRDSNLFTILNESSKTEFSYEQFRKFIILVLGSLREKVNMSEDDIKTIFFILDAQHRGVILIDDLELLKEGVTARLKEFYRYRINRDMVKNTLFKLGKVKNNNIQIYQVKNASLLEFQNIEKAIVEEKHPPKAIPKLKPTKVPHFGPLKGAAMANKQRMTIPAHRSATRVGDSQIKLQRERIEKILRLSKQEKRHDKKGETVASKLRSLFIHKVILPREKMLEEEKQRFSRSKGVENELTIKPSNK